MVCRTVAPGTPDASLKVFIDTMPRWPSAKAWAKAFVASKVLTHTHIRVRRVRKIQQQLLLLYCYKYYISKKIRELGALQTARFSTAPL